MTRLRLPLLLLLSSFLSACVTINVYFPAAAAEKAADRIIDEVWGKEDKPTSETAPDKTPASVKPTPKSDKTPAKSETPKPDKHSSTHVWFGTLLSQLIPAAAANELDINVATPSIQALQTNMSARHHQLVPFYRNGGIGLTANGLISLHDASAVPLKSRSEAQRLIAEENADRNELYQEIANANGQPQWEENIRQIFATRWIQRAHAGWWYQESDGRWTQKQ